MVRDIEDQRVAVEDLCRRFQVRRLELFGSASGERFNPQSSDLDFLVEFEDPPAGGYADAYFGLAESLREFARIPEHQRIIGFRNILIHGHAEVDDRIVWDILQAKLRGLRREVEPLLQTQ